MTVLALEFSSARRSVALARGGVVLAEAVEQTDGRGTNAFALIERGLAAANISRAEIEAIAVGLGPGSYTGIRAALALGQGWRLARDLKLLGVSSVAAIALRAQIEKIFGQVNIVIDAQRGEFYLATWDISATTRQEVSPLKIVSAAEIQSLQASGKICLGPESARQIFPGATEIAILAQEKTAPEETVLTPIYLRAISFVKAPASRDW